MEQPMGLWLEVIGWVGTGFLVFSYLPTNRITLHWIALISSVLKLYYTFEHRVWPLFVNWLVLIVVHVYKLSHLYLGKRRLKREKG